MTLLTWSLLGFALWTLLLVAVPVGAYRWNMIFSGRANFRTWADYEIKGAPWYRRGMRAHANCVENLPVFASLVLVITLAGLETQWLQTLGLVVLGARVLHSVVHVAFEQTNVVVGARSLLYHTQWFAMVGMGLLTAWHAWGA